MKHAITLIIAKTTLGGALALGFAAMPCGAEARPWN